MSSNKESRNLLDELETLQQVLDDAAGEKVDLERALSQLNTVDEVPVLSDLLTEEIPQGASPLKTVVGTNTAPKVAPLRPVANEPTHPLDLRPQPRPLSPSEALDALHKQIDSLPEDQRQGEDWFGKNSEAESAAPPSLDELVTLDEILEADGETPSEPNELIDLDDATPVAPVASDEPEAPAEAPAEKPPTPNPFLPQSVLDRLTRERLAAQHSAEEAHRTMQRVSQRMDQRNAEAAASLSDQARDKLIDEMIQEMIPHIQARLRERLRQMLKPQQPQENDTLEN